MTDSAPIDRPARATPLRAYAGEIHAEPSAAFATLVRLLHAGSGDAAVLAEPSLHFVVVQGGWWYRAEYRVLPSEDGSRIEHELLNVASKAHWAGPIAGRKVLADSPAAFGRLLTELVGELEH
jgi:hypothetical protein